MSDQGGLWWRKEAGKKSVLRNVPHWDKQDSNKSRTDKESIIKHFSLAVKGQFFWGQTASLTLHRASFISVKFHTQRMTKKKKKKRMSQACTQLTAERRHIMCKTWLITNVVSTISSLSLCNQTGFIKRCQKSHLTAAQTQHYVVQIEYI